MFEHEILGPYIAPKIHLSCVQHCVHMRHEAPFAKTPDTTIGMHRTLCIIYNNLYVAVGTCCVFASYKVAKPTSWGGIAWQSS